MAINRWWLTWLAPAPRRPGGISSQPSPRCLLLIGRARATAALADQVLRPAEPPPYGRADWVSCELYREAIHWALLARKELRRGQAEPLGDDVPSPGDGADNDIDHDELASTDLETEDLETLLASSDTDLLVRAAGDAAAFEALNAELRGQSFVRLANLPPKRQTDLAERLRLFTEALLEPLDTVQHHLERIWVVRLTRIMIAAIVLGGLALLAGKARLWLDFRRDLAPTASWTTSSVYPEGGCASPLQRCQGSPNYFFHTHADADGPWLSFDLGSEKTLSAIWVENRLDCCFERAAPLVVSVSTDQSNWQTVARRDSKFKTWRESFERVPARWVRLQAAPGTILHLATVRLIP